MSAHVIIPDEDLADTAAIQGVFYVIARQLDPCGSRKFGQSLQLYIEEILLLVEVHVLAAPRRDLQRVTTRPRIIFFPGRYFYH